MSTAPPAYSELPEEPKQELQDEPEIDTPDGEGLLSRDRPYPPSQFRFPSSQRYTPPSTFPTQTVTVVTTREKIPCGYLCLLVYLAFSVFFCCPIGYVAVLLFKYALNEHRNGRRNNCNVLTTSFVVATVAIVLGIIIIALPTIIVSN